jgi:8-hydroxy-5-deazaflavin:NADPH oxidoreductase
MVAALVGSSAKVSQISLPLGGARCYHDFPFNKQFRRHLRARERLVLMKIAILGGTGKLGLGLAIRLSHTGHEVTIGSRQAGKAEEAAKATGVAVRGVTNDEAAAWCDIALLSVPYASHRSVLEPLQGQLRSKLIIDATVPIDPANLLQIKTESGTSAAEETAKIIGTSDVFAAFQTISHRVLRHPDIVHDVLVAGNAVRKSAVMELIRSMGLRPIDAGPLEVAGHLERMTVLLLSINKANKVKESGIQITGI